MKMKRYLFACLLLLNGAPALAVNVEEMTVLKVCADPYMLPFSNLKEQGFENRIAELFAEKLGVELQYEFFPQRIGFIRNTLRAESESGTGYKCDLVMSAPVNFERAAATNPYYTSSYALVMAKGRGMDDVTSPEMLVDRVKNGGLKIRFGVTDRGQDQFWVFRHGLMGSIVPYQGQPGDPEEYPGKTLTEDLIAGKIDAAIIWGPIIGYFSRTMEGGEDLIMLPLGDDPTTPYLKFSFTVAMAVRHGEQEWRDKVNQLIAENQAEINAIMEGFGVPLLPLEKIEIREDDDD
ncbi:MAG: quinoprotein dehydrogenase-associated putative ABC transporter substrate-binding protein [Gammaproteobacteria bacterium]|nr:quinoprotein dehydrogenase-associated putative ABC transporter substrate-binding protein [Gammaproteobacteria bacterium]